MIPVKIISQKEAFQKGWTGPEDTDKGNAIVGAGGVVTKGPDGKEILLETSIIRANGKREITFMHKKRKKEMLEKGHLANYVENFEIVEGKEKATFIKENNLKELESK